MLCLVPFCFPSKSSSLLSPDQEIASLGTQFSVSQNGRRTGGSLSSQLVKMADAPAARPFYTLQFKSARQTNFLKHL